MNDDPGLPKPARRARPTRRLSKHSSRADQADQAERDSSPEFAAISGRSDGGSLLANPEPPPSAAAPEAIAAPAREPTGWSSAENEAVTVPKPEEVKWSAEQSPLMAALSAVAEATADGISMAPPRAGPPTAKNDAAAPQVVATAASATEVAAMDDEDTAEVLTVDPDSGEVLSGDASPEARASASKADDGSFTEIELEPDGATDTTEIAASDRPGAITDPLEQEVKTKPKIRFPEGAPRRQSTRIEPIAKATFRPARASRSPMTWRSRPDASARSTCSARRRATSVTRDRDCGARAVTRTRPRRQWW
jgi:hypothetical protein